MIRPRSQDVYRGQPWYESRPEPEQALLGVLSPAAAVSGPNTRPSLSFVLVTADARLPVYAAAAGAEIIANWVGPLLRVRGKIVDLSVEGRPRELWIASLAT